MSDSEHDVDVEVAARALKAVRGFAGPVRTNAAVYQSDISWELKPLGEF